jgi:hypothetical protein
MGEDFGKLILRLTVGGLLLLHHAQAAGRDRTH